MENITIENLYDLTETIAAELFTEAEYPWEVLPRIHDFILELGKRLPEEIYEKRGEDIWVAKNAKVAPTACLNGPMIMMRKRRSVTAHLSVAMPLWERVR